MAPKPDAPLPSEVAEAAQKALDAKIKTIIDERKKVNDDYIKAYKLRNAEEAVAAQEEAQAHKDAREAELKADWAAYDKARAAKVSGY